MAKVDLIVTNDGSHSIYLPTLDETYHSKSGAISESKHVYIQHGFDNFTHQPEILILEIGLGTGLNALLTLIKAKQLNIKVSYTSLEPYPLPLHLIKQLNYAKILDIDHEDLMNIHASAIGEVKVINTTFKHLRLNSVFEKTKLTHQYNIIYYDAFAPSKQADIWELDRLKKAYGLLKMGGLLVTYCAQGQFKRNLKTVGFEVENKPGPHEKREITIAIKN